MSTSVSWQDDLTHSRDLSMREIESYGFFVGRFDSWRVQKGLPLGAGFCHTVLEGGRLKQNS